MNTPDTGQIIRPGGRWLKSILILSLAINVVVVGLFVGHLIRKDPGGQGASSQIRWIIKLVPEDRRDFTKTHFRDIRDDLRAALQGGLRKVVMWTDQHGGREALFPDEAAFFNVNTPDDLARAEEML